MVSHYGFEAESTVKRWSFRYFQRASQFDQIAFFAFAKILVGISDHQTVSVIHEINTEPIALGNFLITAFDASHRGSLALSSAALADKRHQPYPRQPLSIPHSTCKDSL